MIAITEKLRIALICICILFCSSVKSMTNSIPLDSLLKMSWTEFTSSPAFSLLAPELIVCQKTMNCPGNPWREVYVYNTKVPWLSIIRDNEGIQLVLSSDKMPYCESKLKPWVLPFELGQAKQVVSLVGLLYIPEMETVYPDGRRVISIVERPNVNVSLVARGDTLRTVEKIVLRRIPNLKRQIADAYIMKRYEDTYMHKSPDELKFNDFSPDIPVSSSLLRPLDFLNASIVTNGISVNGSIFRTILKKRIEINEFDHIGVATNKCIFSEYGIDGYPSICSFKDNRDGKDSVEVIYQIIVNIPSYIDSEYKNYCIPDLPSYCHPPLNPNGTNVSESVMVKKVGASLNFIWNDKNMNGRPVLCSYEDVFLDNTTQLKLDKIRFGTNNIAPKQYSSMLFNSVLFYYLDEYSVFCY